MNNLLFCHGIRGVSLGYSNLVRIFSPVLDSDNNLLMEKYVVAKDVVGAGASETVLVVSGSSARMATGSKDTPVDAAIVAIIDEIKYDPEISDLKGLKEK